MLKRNKKRNIVYDLYNRETGSSPCTVRSNPKIIRRLVESEDWHYKKIWYQRSNRPICYQHKHLFLNNSSIVLRVYGTNGLPSKAYDMQKGKAQERVLDIIVYSQPVVTEPNNCVCADKSCLCLGRYFVFLTKDQWLLQCNFDTGVAVQEMYVKSRNHAYGFGYCSWNLFGSQFVITSRLNPDHKNSKVVGYMAVFTVSPFKPKWMFELTRDVFGKYLGSVNVSEQLLIAAVNADYVDIYGFEDVLKEGIFLSPDNNSFETGTKGLELNFRIQRAPPVLFRVKSMGQSVQFGGYPYHCLIPTPKNPLRFFLKNLDNGNLPARGYIENDSFWTGSLGVSFHPDFSNRVLVQNLKSLQCLTIINKDNCVGLEESFEIKIPEPSNSAGLGVSNFGRKIKRVSYFHCERAIFAFDYEDEMDLIGILGTYPNDSRVPGFIKLYDGTTGEEVKTIELPSLNEHSDYQLNLDLDIIVVIVKDFESCHRTFVYKLESIRDHLQG